MSNQGSEMTNNISTMIILLVVGMSSPTSRNDDLWILADYFQLGLTKIPDRLRETSLHPVGVNGLAEAEFWG